MRSLLEKYPGVAILLLTVTFNAHGAYRARIGASARLREAISTGMGDHTCQVMSDGTARCWGLNDHGQLGDGSGSNQPTPVTVAIAPPTGTTPAPPLTGIVAVAAGLNHTCALLNTGTVRCWGDNSAGQLGDNTQTIRPTQVSVVVPVPGQTNQFAPLTNAVALAAGGRHTCALLGDGTVRCWGDNTSGQVGDGTSNNTRLTPVTVTNLSNPLALTAGSSHTCAVLGNGRARCWGLNTDNQLGDGTAISRPTPADVSVPDPNHAGQFLPLTNVTAIAAGDLHTCALISDGTARCWGPGDSGRLGDGSDSGHASTPVVVSGVAGAVAIDGGGKHTCALLAGGTALCWGLNVNGQVGDGSPTLKISTPVPVALLTQAVALAAGAAHSCAVVVDGSARCWGHNTKGQLGNGVPADSRTPVVVSGGGGSVTASMVAVGNSYSCALRSNGTAACWGNNGAGQLGDGTTTSRSVPVAVMVVDPNQPGQLTPLTNIAAVSAYNGHTCALIGGGTVRCWGSNSNGQLGNGDLTGTTQTSAVAVSNLNNVVAVAAGFTHTCALLGDGKVWCWGYNGSGQLGNGTQTDSFTPVAVSSLTNVVAIAAGGNHTCAIVVAGTVQCWGANDFAQLGDNTTTLRTRPVVLAGSPIARAITAGHRHTCLLQVPQGLASCWGNNAQGEVGDGTTASPRLVRTAVGNLINATAISGGGFHTCALTSDGGARCWGDNEAGEIGDNTTSVRLSAVSVVSDSSLVPITGLVQVTAGGLHTCALQGNGGPLCWGSNSSGQLGDGTAANRFTPGAVPSFTVNIDPTVLLDSNTRTATVRIIATCESGGLLHVRVTLSQGAASGLGILQADCTGKLEKYPLVVPAAGTGFSTGPALVEAEAGIRQAGAIVDTQRWTRRVTVVPAP